MVRCDDFYKKWEECGNFCEKHPDTADKINKYLDFIHEIEGREDLEPEVKKTMVGMSERAVRPLIKEKDPEIRENVIKKIGETVKSPEPIKEGLGDKINKGRPQKIKKSRGRGFKKQEDGSFKKKITTRDVERIIRKEKAKKQVKTPRPPIPINEFNVIYADPPWQYQQGTATPTRKIENQYLTMDLEEIKKIKFNTSKDAVLFLWATSPLILEAIEVMKAWGFKYKTQAIWDKKIVGMGYWFRGQHEILLLGVKGDIKPPQPSNRFSSVISEKRGNHSNKPECVYKMIEIMFPKDNYLELFGRNKRDGWTVWGNEL